MNKLNPFKPFIVLGLIFMYAAIFLITCVLAVALMLIPEMPTSKAIVLVGMAFVWLGLVIAIIASHVIVSHNRKIEAARIEVLSGV